jgi:hypothetical protein
MNLKISLGSVYRIIITDNLSDLAPFWIDITSPILSISPKLGSYADGDLYKIPAQRIIQLNGWVFASVVWRPVSEG